jgi:hypothetical protein
VSEAPALIVLELAEIDTVGVVDVPEPTVTVT